MNNNDISQIRSLIDRFMEAETSIAEEKRLSDYFASGNVAEELLPYREMFGWYDSLSQESNPDTGRQPEKATRMRILPLKLWQWASIAAMTALLFTAGLYLRTSAEDINDTYLAYQGSYIVRDGKKITDLSIVVPEAERIERELEARLSDLDNQIEDVDNRINASITSGLDMDNPLVSAIMDDALN